MKAIKKRIPAWILSFIIIHFSARGQSILTLPGSINSYDYLLTHSGQLVFGELIRIERGKLFFDIHDFGEEDVNLKKVKEITAISTNFLIDLENQGRIIGKLKTLQGDSLLVFNETDSVKTIISAIIYVRRMYASRNDQLEGMMGAGYSYTRASGIGRIDLSNQLVYETEKLRLFQNFSAILTLADTMEKIDRLDVSVGGIYSLTSKWMALQYLQYQKIPSAGVRSRLVSITGGGRRIIHKRNIDLNVISGITFQKEYSTEGIQAAVQTEWPLLVDCKASLIHPELDFTFLSVYYNSLSVKGRYRFDSRVQLDYEIFKDFDLGLRFLFNYDNKPLEKAARHADLTFSLILGYEF